MGKDDEPILKKTTRCAYCRAEFEPRRWWQRFCSTNCKFAWYRDEKRAALALYRKSAP